MSLPASQAKGAVTTFTSRLPIILNTRPITLNCGSLIEPLMGRLTSMTPLRSASSARASRTGRLVALGLSMRSPKVSWFRMIWLRASSRPSASMR